MLQRSIHAIITQCLLAFCVTPHFCSCIWYAGSFDPPASLLEQLPDVPSLSTVELDEAFVRRQLEVIRWFDGLEGSMQQQSAFFSHLWSMPRFQSLENPGEINFTSGGMQKKGVLGKGRMGLNTSFGTNQAHMWQQNDSTRAEGHFSVEVNSETNYL